MTVAKEPGPRGEHEVTVKTIAQGRPDVVGEPVVTTLVCFIYFAREAAGATGTRLSLRPLFSGQKFLHSSGASRREDGEVCLKMRARAKLSAVVARLDRAIQYSRDPSDQSRSRGVLDTPLSLSRGMTGHCWEGDSDGHTRACGARSVGSATSQSPSSPPYLA
jgi:hypothetical protein